MKLLTLKKQNYIAKRLAAIYYIAVHGFGKDRESDICSMSKIIENVADIAFEVGGERYATTLVPSLVYDLQCISKREDGDNDG